MRSLVGLIALAFPLVSVARAEILCHAVDVPLTQTNWSTTVQLPRFDPSLGTLNLVDVCVTGQAVGAYGLENPDPAPGTITGAFAANVSLYRPDSSLIATAIPSQAFSHPLGPFDGTIDLGGTSGVFVSGISVLATTQIDLTAAADLALFTGAPGNPGALVFQIVGQGVSTASGSGHIIVLFQTQAAGIISICYDYTPVAAPFCAGDGTQTPCPCGNNSSVGADQGCLNSFGMGAALRGVGIASVASDSLVLTCSNLHGATTGLFFQGTAQAGGGAGTAFGDGVRCVLGTNSRIGTKTASAGSATYPQAGDAPISVRGSVPANSTRYYQFWYRNVASFCTAAAFNLSQGVEVQWTL